MKLTLSKAWMSDCPELVEIIQAQRLQEIIDYANESIDKANATLKRLNEIRESAILASEINELVENINMVLEHIWNCEASLEWARAEMKGMFFMN
jgi:hypothetical protein